MESPDPEIQVLKPPTDQLFSSTLSEPPATPSQAPRRSYAAVTNTIPSLKKHAFEINLIAGVSKIRVPTDVKNSTPLYEDFLVGRFPSDAPHIAKIHVIVNKIWTLGDKSIKIDAYENSSSSVRFRIKDPATRNRILRRGMWNIAGQPMILAKWSPIPEETQPAISSMPLWVTLTNVPYSLYSREGLGFLTSPIGQPIRLHPETELCSNFEEAKVFVEVNLTKSLPKSFCFQLDQETEATVNYLYPWLPPRCFRCEKWGHTDEVCVVKQTIPSTTVNDDKNQKEVIEEGDMVADGKMSMTSAESEEPNGTGLDIQGGTPQDATNEKTMEFKLHSPIHVPTADSELRIEAGPIQVTDQCSLVADSNPIVEAIVVVEDISTTLAHEDIVGTKDNDVLRDSALLGKDTLVGNVSGKGFKLLGFSVSDEESQESSDSDSETGMMDLLTPSDQMLLRERPVKPSIKAMQMQTSSKARGRGNRGRGNHGGRG